MSVGLDTSTRDELYQEVKRLQWKLAEAQNEADAILRHQGKLYVRAERLEDMLGSLVDACERSGVTQIPAGAERLDLEQLRAVIDSAKCFLP